MRDNPNSYIEITEVNLSAFVFRRFHEDLSPVVRTNIQYIYICSDDWGEIFMKQSVNKCR